jgi:hypothetical protein
MIHSQISQAFQKPIQGLQRFGTLHFLLAAGDGVCVPGVLHRGDEATLHLCLFSGDI